MYVPFEIGSKKFLIEPYTTKQERDFLLLSSFSIDDFQRLFEILNYKTDEKISDLTIEEQKVLLYKFRDISLGDEAQVNFDCDNCHQHNEVTIEASNFLIPSTRNDSDVKKLNKKVTDENLQEFVDIDVDLLNIDEFEELKQRVDENQIHFDFVKEARCLMCGHTKKLDMGESKFMIDIMSDDSLMTLYKTINYMVFFGHYSKEDIDNMIPFERTILSGLLKKTKEDMLQ